MAETKTSASRDRDVDNFSRDETRRWYDVETETTTLTLGFSLPDTLKPET